MSFTPRIVDGRPCDCWLRLAEACCACVYRRPCLCLSFCPVMEDGGQLWRVVDGDRRWRTVMEVGGQPWMVLVGCEGCGYWTVVEGW